MSIIVGVRFKPVGKIYYFDPNGIELSVNDSVIVETARGIECGKVVIGEREIKDEELKSPLKPVIRKANQEDIKQVEKNNARKEEALKIAEEKIKKHKLDMKLVDVEFTFDNQKVIFTFTSEGRVDFRELVRDLASVFRIRIELRQIGIRDESKIKGGIAPCGRICCCNAHMGDFERVSIKMAKTQCLSLNPTKISGLCGRLMCCLAYENEHYAETYKMMPKIGSEVITEDGKGVVLNNDMLRRIVNVKIEKNGGEVEYKKFPLDKITIKEKMADDDDNIKVDEEIKKILD